MHLKSILLVCASLGWSLIQQRRLKNKYTLSFRTIQ